jgi:hypothetical protein
LAQKPDFARGRLLWCLLHARGIDQARLTSLKENPDDQSLQVGHTPPEAVEFPYMDASRIASRICVVL